MPEEKNCLQAIARLAIDMGAADVGFSALERETDGMTGSISIVVPLSDAVVEELNQGPTHTYFHHYRTVNALLDQIALRIGLLLQREGWRYLPVAASQSINLPGSPPFSGRFSHKQAAVAAGLGDIGQSNLFLHRRYGAPWDGAHRPADAAAKGENAPVHRLRRLPPRLPGRRHPRRLLDAADAARGPV